MRAFLPIAVVLFVLLSLAAVPNQAQAGGYDTPILYSARHMGMGGTAQAYVNDPSALFHNPAGLGNIDGSLSLLADVSFGYGFVSGVPSSLGETTESNASVLPFFLVGGAYKFNDWFSAGLGVYPVAAAGGTYEYNSLVDTTSLFFLEISPGVAFTVPESVGIGHLSVGLGYRMTYVSLSRSQGPETGAQVLEFDAAGMNFAGFRAGIQWAPVEEFSMGFSYRHRIDQDVTADTGQAFFREGRDLSTSFTLPTRFAFGVRGDIDMVGLAADVEYALQSQNDRAVVSGTYVDTGMDVAVTQIFSWNDAVTLRLGAEVKIPVSETMDVTPRLGYIFDGETTNRAYPSIFGTPPAVTHSGTIGVGLDGGPWEVNLAYALRQGSTSISRDDLPNDENMLDVCGALCGGAGDYSITLHGIYADFSYNID